MAYISKHKTEVRSEGKEVLIKLEITLNINTSTGQVKVGTDVVPVQSVPQEMKGPEYILPKFEETTELIEGFGN